MTIGFIGQGWIGKNYADDFEQRGYAPVRYALEEPYVQNADAITKCDIVFIAVPTPTTPEGFNVDIVRSALTHIGEGKIAVIKSTILPGITEKLQAEFPSIYVMHSPEFLTEKTAAYDASHPNRNIIGIPKDTEEYRMKAEGVLSVLPEAPYKAIMPAKEAELVKYAGNCFLYTKVIFMNMLHDLVESVGGEWEHVREAMIHDPRIGESHTQPVHQSGRGAGGNCFIKDYEAFRTMYEAHTHDTLGSKVLEATARKNIELLSKSGKDQTLLEGVYGDLNKYVG